MISIDDPFGLRDRVSVVFGVGPGIGEETVRTLALAGSRVAAVDLDPEVARRTATTVSAEMSDPAGDDRPRVVAVQADVTRRPSVVAGLEEVVGSLGAPSAVIDVVGYARPGAVDDVTDAGWRDLLEVNLHQQFIVAQESVRVMAEPAAYVAITSINGVVSSPYNAAYGAAKAGLVSLVRTMAAELAHRGIRVNAVAPGIVATPRIVAALDAAGRGAEFTDSVPMDRIGDPHEIARAATFLASPLASYITGQTLVADGGATVQYPLALPVVPTMPEPS